MHASKVPRYAKLSIFSQLQIAKPRYRLYATAATKNPSRSRNFVIATTVAAFAGIGYFCVTDTRSRLHRLAVPVLRTIYPDAEEAHEVGVKSIRGLSRFNLHPRSRCKLDEARDLEIEVFGQRLDNPLGISAGLDKHGEIPTQLLALGPAIVEIGGITPLPQKGNPKPRVFRLPSAKGLINRYGLNSDGAELVAARLRHRVREYAYGKGYGLNENAELAVLNGEAGVPPGSLVKGKLLAIQVAKNEFTPASDLEAVRRDYVAGTSLLARYADIIVVNVSCPNEPGYRELQRVEPLMNILTGVVEAVASIDRKTKPAIMIKVSPDEDTEKQVRTICGAVRQSGVDGVIVGNTTTSRPDPRALESDLSRTEAAIMKERGGYSGPQLYNKTLSLVKRYRRELDRPMLDQTEQQQTSIDQTAQQRTGRSVQPNPSARKMIFCTGGITSGQDALEVLEAGADVAMVYTALVYGGSSKITCMKQEMRQEIRKALESEVLGQ